MDIEQGSVAVGARATAQADIGHVHLRVADLDRAIDFYTNTLGMRVVLRQPKHAFLAFGDYHHHLALDSRGSIGPRAADADDRAGLHHFAIRFPDQRSLAVAIARVTDAGGEPKGADFTVSQSAFTKDPDGNGIELTCDQPRASWPAGWASVEGLGRWRQLDPAAIGRAARAAPSRFLAVGAADGAAYWTVGMRMVVLVPSSATDGRFTLCEFTCPTGFATPLHMHSREDETFRVTEGEMRYLCGDTAHSASPGSTVHLPRGVQHAFATAGDQPLHVLHTASPSGMEGFHIAVGVPASEAPPDPAKLDRDAIARVAAEYGITTLAPPPAALLKSI
jgi:catechol 2,3-dioxygenase